MNMSYCAFRNTLQGREEFEARKELINLCREIADAPSVQKVKRCKKK